MPEETTEKKITVADIAAVANNKNFTTIANSNSEFCIYTYKAEYETYYQLVRPGFFNPAYSFLNPGDVIRIFRFESKTKLVGYIEVIVTDVDKVTKSVKVALIRSDNLVNKELK